jgi:hypothetical protein
MKKFEAMSRTMQKEPSSRRERSHGGKIIMEEIR